ncbi:MAG TPA: ArsB/NhaD family transporter [Ktedonobacterales bacterium]|nr:ArsB/NhaD family transporter [Ktedonobacterales bacterium]
MAHIVLGALIFVATLALIMIRPWRLSEAVIAACGGLLMLVCGIVTPVDATNTLLGQWNIYGFFLGLMLISAIADAAGIFDILAYQAARLAGGSSLRLYLAIFAVGVVITAFLSNDATALILTPVVYALVTRLRLPVLPFMFACTFIADTASFLLPVSNPINILVLNTFGGNLGTFIHYLALPALVCVTLNIGLFTLIFRRALTERYDASTIARPQVAPGFLRMVTVGLLAIGLGYVVASAVGAPVSIVALAGSAMLLGCAAWSGQLHWNRWRSDISWSLFVFVSGMFLLVRGVENLGLTTAFGQVLLHLAGTSQLRSVALVAGGTALGANLINNVPMTLVMISAVHGVQSPPTIQMGMAFAIILGADLGPNLTTVGSLATILWLLILRRKGLEVSTREYLKLGLAVVPVMLMLGVLLIWLRL